jgi:tRNA pseudouridine55 synthase
VGPFRIEAALTLQQLAERDDPVPIPLDAAVAAAFPRRDLSPEEARILGHGGRLEPLGRTGPYGAYDPDGRVIALLEEHDGVARPVVVFRPG